MPSGQPVDLRWRGRGDLMKTGQNVYLQLGSPLTDAGVPRALHRGLVMASTDELWTVALEGPEQRAQPGIHAVVFYNLDREFVQQPARIESVDRMSPCILDLQPTGDPTSAEQRENLRVTAVGADASAQVGRELDCRLQDVSSTGFAIATTELYAIGERLPVTLAFRGRAYVGQVQVQNARQLWAHRIRYGLHCVAERSAGGDLTEGLHRLSIELRRASLERYRGS